MRKKGKRRMRNAGNGSTSHAYRKETRREKSRIRNKRLSILAALVCAVVAYLALSGAKREYPGLAANSLTAGGIFAAIECLLLLAPIFTKFRVNRFFRGAIELFFALSLITATIAYRYVRINGQVYAKSETVLDFSNLDAHKLEGIEKCDQLASLNLNGSSFDDFPTLFQCTNLTYLDLRGNDFVTADIYMALKAQLPDCEIVWSIPLFGTYYDSNLPQIDLREHRLGYDEMTALNGQYPDIDFIYSFTVLGVEATSLDTLLDLNGIQLTNVAELCGYLDFMPALEKVDLRGHPLSKENMDTLSAGYPGIEFIFTFSLWGVEVTSLDTELDFSGIKIEDLAILQGYEAYLPKLARVNLCDTGLSFPDFDQLYTLYPDLEFVFSFTMFGVEVTTEATEIDLNKKPISTIEEVEKYIAYLPNVKHIEMCKCGLSNESMAELRDRHPDIKFVWVIEFGKYTLRTDATAFSTLLAGSNDYYYNSKTFQPLQYCTDLEALDLGHNHITNISFLSGLTKLKILILACNRISDITPLAEMDELEYVELFTNQITDFSPLANKVNLLDLNICRNAVKSIEPLLTCTSLDRLWIGKCGLSTSEVNKLKGEFPNCKINTASGDSPTTGGWRVHKRYDVMKEIFRTRVYRDWE